MRNVTILCFVSIILFCSCRSDLKANKSTSTNKFDIIINQELLLPPFIPYNKCYRIVNFIDGDCSVCIEKLVIWENLINSCGNHLNSETILFIVYSSNIPKFEYYYEKANLTIDYYLDTENSYCRVNNIDNSELNTMLIDSLNRIKLVGDPLSSKNLLNNYLEALRNSNYRQKPN